MENEVLRPILCDYASKVKSHNNCIRDAVNWIKENLPMEEELKEISRIMYDSNGEIFLYYDGVYYSWKIIISILKKQEMITIDALYDRVIN